MTTYSLKSLLISSCILFFSTTCMAAQTCRTETEIPDLNKDSRYTDNADGTITDKDTGLMWKQCVEGLSGSSCATGSAATYAWKATLELADVASFAGYLDWRAPNVKELESLVARNCISPAINEMLFPNTPASTTWTSSLYTNNSTYSLYVSFSTGFSSAGTRAAGRSVRLVRSGL